MQPDPGVFFTDYLGWWAEIAPCKAAGFLLLDTGRTAYRPFVARPLALFDGQGTDTLGTPGDLGRTLATSQTRHLLRTPLVGVSEEEPFDRLGRRGPDRLEAVLTDAGGRFLVYRVQGP